MFRVRIRELREAAGYKSQRAFGDAFGAAQTTVANWEGGKREPNYETTKRLADFFSVSVDYLLGRTDDPTPIDEKSSSDEPELDINTLEYALYGEARILDDDEKQQLLDLARLLAKKRKEHERNS